MTNDTTKATVRALANLAADNVRKEREERKKGNVFWEGYHNGKVFAYSLAAKHVWNMAKLDM